ncbi:MoaD/ThiS family protein [bacterium]|nr:MoaD/ThiS family protein [bacterium]
MQVKVLFFGPAKDVTGLSHCDYTIESHTPLQDIIVRLYADFPKAKEVFDLCSFVINKDFATPETVLKDQDQIAVLPPVSGG